jgi:hypothetical protein
MVVKQSFFPAEWKISRYGADLARLLQKEPVVCWDASYGFLANRAYFAMRMEAVQMVYERVAPPEEIDRALKLGYNLPMGPLELADMGGSWAIYASSEEDRIRELGSEKGRLHPLIRLMVRAGYTVREVLCGHLGVDPNFLERHIQTIFHDGKAVDDLDSEAVKDGSTLALSAAMPGLAGAILRRQGILDIRK